MKLNLTLNAQGRDIDLTATVDSSVTVGDLARRLALSDPLGRQEPPSTDAQHTVELLDAATRLLDPRSLVSECGLRSGVRVRLGWVGAQFGGGENAVLDLLVLEGPDRGRTFPVSSGTSYIGRGRGCEVQLSDALASRHHARLVVTDVVEIVDLGSANGTLIGGQPVTRARLLPGDNVVIGDTRFTMVWKDKQHEARVSSATNGVLGIDGDRVLFSRSPVVSRVFGVKEFPLPELPERPRRAPLPWLMATLPLLFAVVMYFTTGNASSLIFFLLMPLMLLGSAMESRSHTKREYAASMREFLEDVSKITERIRAEQLIEHDVRNEEHPAIEECLAAVDRRSSQLWFRRRDLPRYLDLRVGLGALPSRCTTEMPQVGRSKAEAWLALEKATAGLELIDDVPVVVTPLTDGAVGVAGRRDAALPVAYSLVMQAASLHSPAELVVTSFASAASAPSWDFLKWLPHVASAQSPIGAQHLAATGPACTALADQLDEVVASRSSRDAAPWSTTVLVIIEGDAPIDRSRLVDIAERGVGRGVAVLWIAEGQPRLPAVCTSYVIVEEGATVGYVRQSESVTPVRLQACTEAQAAGAARLMAPLIDAGVRSEDSSDLPRQVSLLSLAGAELATSHTSVVERWTESRSILTGPFASEPNRRPANLRALIGQSALGAFSLDLRADGPHALVGGTTGSGKSELLQAWILGLATAHSPQRVTFLLVDYKGGSAFRECTNLPHTLGLVTDLSPHLVRRALISLSAELRYREHLLATYKAKDLLELERRGEVDTPPSLIIIVDEFAALVHEVPEFVDGVVNVAQRGRSLGLHLILATQRPAGVIKDNLRANTNLRVALRMADESDSDDVLGSTQAAFFDPAVPGRAVSKSGPARLTPFQTGYAGGWTSTTPPPPEVSVRTLSFGPAQEWVYEEPHEAGANPGPTDIQKLVSSIKEAAELAQVPEPRKPWLPSLANVYDLAALPSRRRDDDFTYAMVDLPDSQQQPTLSFRPDVEGNLAVFGVSGSGTSTLLRTIAVGAGYTINGGPCQVYGLDFGNRDLHVLESLPHVGSIINGSDHERVVRLITHLEKEVDRRRTAYQAVNAGSIGDYRRLAGVAAEARIFLLIDGTSALKQAYEVSGRYQWLDRLGAVAAAGRPLGIHLVLAVDQRGGLPASLSPAIQSRIVMRMSSDDYLSMGVAGDVLTADTPAGRGLRGPDEIQVAVLGGSTDPAKQARAIVKFGDAARRAGVAAAPAIESLAERVELRELPPMASDRPVLGVASSSLLPQTFQPSGTFVITGPSGSGRTTAVRTVCIATRRALPTAEYHLLTLRAASPVASLGIWASTSVGPQGAVDGARRLAKALRDRNDSTPVVVVLERADELTADAGEEDVEDLVRVCIERDHFVVAEADAQFFSGSYGLPSRLRTSRTGIVLHPEGSEGNQAFRTDLPSLDRSQLPAGRGFYVTKGTVELVQVAIP